jgi:hypothetical protein
MSWPVLTTTDWILIAGFVLVYQALRQIHGALTDIHAEVMNIEAHTSPPTIDDFST